MRTIAITAIAAAGLSVATAEDYPAPIRAIIGQGVQIHAEFQAPSGLMGYVGQFQGEPLVVYVTGDGEHLLVGPMLDARGGNLTERHLEDYGPEPDLSGVWEALEQSHWIGEGQDDAEKVVYMFTDPECPYCNAFWRASRPYLGDDVQLRYVLVGMLRPSSMGKAAAILAADEPVTALAHHETAKANGGIEPLNDLPADAEQRLAANLRLMQELGAFATPAIYYRDGDGQVQQVMGMPGLDVIAEEIFRKRKQPNKDPELERFR